MAVGPVRELDSPDEALTEFGGVNILRCWSSDASGSSGCPRPGACHSTTKWTRARLRAPSGLLAGAVSQRSDCSTSPVSPTIPR